MIRFFSSRLVLFSVFFLVFLSSCSFALITPDRVLLPGSHKVVPIDGRSDVFFEVEPEDFSIVSFSVSGPSDYVPQMIFYDESEKVIRDVKGSEGEKISFSYVVGRGKYFLKVNTFKAGSEGLVLVYDSVLQNDALTGGDGSSDFRKASVIDVNKEYEGLFGDEDVIDSFKIPVHSGESIDVVVKSEGYINLKLLDTDNQKRYDQQEHKGRPLTASFKASADGFFTVIIEGEDVYSLVVSSDYEPEVVLDSPDSGVESPDSGVEVLEVTELDDGLVGADEVIDESQKVLSDVETKQASDGRSSFWLVVLLLLIIAGAIYFFIKKSVPQAEDRVAQPGKGSRRKRR